VSLLLDSIVIPGVLSVIDINSDPVEVYEFISNLGAENIDFVLPHFNWSNKPPRFNTKSYGKWYEVIWRESLNSFSRQYLGGKRKCKKS